MPIKYVTIDEALEKGYEIIEPEPIRRTAPPTWGEMATMGALEIGTPLVAGMTGWGILGVGAGATLGNTLAQNYRMSVGLQDEFDWAEASTATAAAVVPVGRLANLNWAQKVGVRALQGSGISTVEGTARSLLQTGEPMSKEALVQSAIFGGVIGGGLGGVEALFYRGKNVDASIGDTEVDLAKKIKDRNVETGKDPEVSPAEEIRNDSTSVASKQVLDIEAEVADVKLRMEQGLPLNTRQQTIRDHLINEPPPVDADSFGIGSQEKSRMTAAQLDEYDRLYSARVQANKDLVEARPTPDDVNMPRNMGGGQDQPVRVKIGNKQKILEFNSDIDKALFLLSINRNTKNTLRWLRGKNRLPGRSDKELQNLAEGVKQRIVFPAVKAADSNRVRIQKSKVAVGLQDDITIAKKEAIQSDIEVLEGRLNKISKDVRELPPHLDDAARDASPEWLTGDMREYVHSDRGWVIRLLQREEMPDEYVLYRNVEERLEQVKAYKSLDEAKDGKIEMELREKNGEADSQFPWMYAKTVKHNRKLFAMDEDGNPIIEKGEVFKSSKIDGKTVLLQEVDFREFGVRWIRYGDVNRTDMTQPPKLNATSKKKLESKLRKAKISGVDLGFSAMFVGAVASRHLTDEDEKAMMQAGLGGVLYWAFLAGLGIYGARFLKTKMGQYFKNNPEARVGSLKNRSTGMDESGSHNGDTLQDTNLAQAMDNAQVTDAQGVPFKEVGWWKKNKDYVWETIKHAAQPMSQSLKKINEVLATVFRNHELHVRKRVKEFTNKLYFVYAMEKVIRNGKDANDWKLFRLALVNKAFHGDKNIPPRAIKAQEDLDQLMDKYNDKVIEFMRGQKDQKTLGAKALYVEFNKAMDDLRIYAKDRGNLNLAPLENYFPRGIKNWEEFRKFMQKHKNWNEITSDIDKAIAAQLAKKNTLTDAERASIAASVLKLYKEGTPTTATAHSKQRLVEEIDELMIDAYVDPSKITDSYVNRIVNATETRHFLGMKESKPTSKPYDGPDDILKGEMIDERVNSLGILSNLDEGIGDAVTQISKKYNVKDDDVKKLQDIIRARFNTSGHSELFHDVKNATYLATLGNFGATITQLGDISYSMHFSGMDNTFRAMFKRRDWYKELGLDGVDVDLVSSRDGIAKVVNTVFKLTGFKQLDKYAKNVTMEAAFLKLRNMAKNDPASLIKELRKRHGEEVAIQVKEDLLSNDPNVFYSDRVDEVIWSKLLDLQPVAAIEMPLLHGKASTLPIGAREVVGGAYWLKTFTLKQLDVFHQAGIKNIMLAKQEYAKGNKKRAAVLARKGISGTVGLALVFGAANASTSMIKDIMYGRKINMDELIPDTLFRLAGVSRYHMWSARRQGPVKTALEFLMPPVTALDRAFKDLGSLSAGEAPAEVYKGIAVGDFYYWHYGGGREKTRRDLAKRLGVPLKYIAK